MKKLIIGGASVLAVAVVGTGVYLAGPGSDNADASVSAASEQVADQMADQVAGEPVSDQPQAGNQRPLRHPRLRRLARRGGVHGEATVRTKKGFVQITWQRGQITGKSGNSLTVRSLDGTVWQWQTDGNTRVRKDAQKSAVANLATNDYVVIAGLLGPGNKHTAKAVVVPKKVPAKATQSPAPTPS